MYIYMLPVSLADNKRSGAYW